MQQQRTEAAAIEAEIAHLRSLTLDALRRRWRAVFGRTPPAPLSKALLGRMIAWRLQEQAFAGLDRDSLRFLDTAARPGAGSNPARCSFATITVSATPSPSQPMGLSGKARPMPVSPPSPAPSPA